MWAAPPPPEGVAAEEEATMARRKSKKTCKYGFRKGSRRCRKTPKRR